MDQVCDDSQSVSIFKNDLGAIKLQYDSQSAISLSLGQGCNYMQSVCNNIVINCNKLAKMKAVHTYINRNLY